MFWYLHEVLFVYVYNVSSFGCNIEPIGHIFVVLMKMSFFRELHLCIVLRCDRTIRRVVTAVQLL
jgi:hypothetical protein